MSRPRSDRPFCYQRYDVVSPTDKEARMNVGRKVPGIEAHDDRFWRQVGKGEVDGSAGGIPPKILS